MQEATVAMAGWASPVLAACPEAEGWLSQQERDRASAFRFPEDRRDFVAARALARRCAAAVVGSPPGALRIVQWCRQCAAPHGRPSLVEHPDIGLSWSHSHGYLAAVAGPGAVGVDVEVPHGGDWGADGIARMVLSDNERRQVAGCRRPDLALLRQWVRKEAMVKAGVASLDQLREVDLASLPPEPEGLLVSQWDGWHILDWTAVGKAAIGTVVSRSLPSLRAV
jgi:4'-phosphopantetheinyl transferase